MIFVSVEYNTQDGEHYLKFCSDDEIICMKIMESPLRNPVYPGGRISNENIHELIKYLKENVMPLVKGNKARSKKGFSENIKREMHAGKKQSQAIAIAYSEARRGKKKAMKK